MSTKTPKLINRTRISNAVENSLYEQLQELSNKTMIPISKLLDRAIELLIQEYVDKEAPK